jgi:hypothetical protein
VLFFPQKFLFWASPPCQGIQTLLLSYLKDYRFPKFEHSKRTKPRCDAMMHVHLFKTCCLVDVHITHLCLCVGVVFVCVFQVCDMIERICEKSGDVGDSARAFRELADNWPEY